MSTIDNAALPPANKSLRDADMISAPATGGSVAREAATDPTAVERRTVLRVAAAGVAGAATFTLGMRPAYAMTDADQGPNYDPPGRGRGAAGGGRVPNRGEQPTGYSDRDPNDPSNYGATPPGQESLSGGRRREYTGLNDRDPADPAGYGSRMLGFPPGYSRSGCTDTDPGDPQFGGRHCR